MLSGTYDGKYQIKRFELLNCVKNVNDASCDIGGAALDLTPGYYSESQLATELQAKLVGGLAGTTVVFDSKADTYTVTFTSSRTLTTNAELSALTGLPRQSTGTVIVSSNPTNMAPYPYLDVSVGSQSFKVYSSAGWKKMIRENDLGEINFQQETNPGVVVKAGSHTQQLINFNMVVSR